jgi:hypothetical protein
VLKRVQMRTWEKGQPKIDKIYEDVGGWRAKVIWHDSKVNTYPVKMLYTRCPQKAGRANADRGLLTDRKQVFSYYECEIRRLRAEKKSTGQFRHEWVHESTSELTTPQTPSIASHPPPQWRAPEANMYEHEDGRPL